MHLEKPEQRKQAHYLDKPVPPCRGSVTTEGADLFFSFFLKLNEHANLQKGGKNENDSTTYESKIISVNQCCGNAQKDI